MAFDQLTVNEYEPGVGLSAHVDTHSAFTGKSLSTLESNTLVPKDSRLTHHSPSLAQADSNTLGPHCDTSWHAVCSSSCANFQQCLMTAYRVAA